jgi:hypothetical protein
LRPQRAKTYLAALDAEPELCRSMLSSIFSQPGSGNAVEDFLDEKLSLCWCEVLCDEVRVNADTQHSLRVAMCLRFGLNHDLGQYGSSNAFQEK